MSVCNAHILVVDDDERIRKLLCQFLEIKKFLVSAAQDAAHARKILAGLQFDLIVADIMMPGEDGISFVNDLRPKLSTPFLLLTAKGETESKIKGLEAGADDYMSKPFEPKELLLRINAILRRTMDTDSVSGEKTLNIGAYQYKIERGELWEGKKPVRLTSTENKLMKIFSNKPGKILSRMQIVEKLGYEKNLAQERVIDVQITRLRRKIEANSKHPRYLQTVRGEGYIFMPD